MFFFKKKKNKKIVIFFLKKNKIKVQFFLTNKNWGFNLIEKTSRMIRIFIIVIT